MTALAEPRHDASTPTYSNIGALLNHTVVKVVPGDLKLRGKIRGGAAGCSATAGSADSVSIHLLSR